MDCIILNLTSLVKWCFNFAFSNFKHWSPLSLRYGIFIHIVSKSLLVVFFILFTFRPLSLLLIMASPILLGEPFHTIRSFILVSSACNLFLSRILTARCIREERSFVAPWEITVIMSVLPCIVSLQ